jgi:hypothetical protein
MVASKLQPPGGHFSTGANQKTGSTESRIVAISEPSKLIGDYMLDQTWSWSVTMGELRRADRGYSAKRSACASALGLSNDVLLHAMFLAKWRNSW